MVKNHLSECQLIQIGFDESSINLDKLQESKGALIVNEAENHIVTQAEQMPYGRNVLRLFFGVPIQ